MSLVTDKELSEYSGKALDMSLMDVPRHLVDLLARIKRLESEVDRLKGGESIVSSSAYPDSPINEGVSIIGYIPCSNCKHQIPSMRDDYYNIEHDKIQCPECFAWQDVD